MAISDGIIIHDYSDHWFYRCPKCGYESLTHISRTAAKEEFADHVALEHAPRPAVR